MSGIRLLLLVAVAMVAAAGSGRTNSPDDGDRGAAGRPLLREGTQIPPTSGRFRRVGRRWEFVSDTADELADAATQAEDARFEEHARFEDARPGDGRNPPNRGQRGAATRVRRGISGPPSQADAEPPAPFGREPFGREPFPARGTNRAARPTSRGGSRRIRDVRADPASPPVRRPDVPRMLVVENLMLQRIEEAVRDDPTANRWTVTGFVTEYQNENRLVVTTAERGDAR